MKHHKKLTYIYLLLTLFINTFCTYGQGKDFISHDFNNGSLNFFEVCTTKNPNYSSVVNNRVKTYWTESGYDGGRVSKGAEFCFPEFVSLKETWMGFTMNIDSSHRNDTQSGVAQIFQFIDNDNIFTWTGMLLYQYGDLILVHRSGKNTSSKVYKTIYEDYPRGQDMDIIIHYVLSGNNQGLIEVWVNDVKKYTINNINFGFGNWNSNDEQYDDTYVELKLGQYDYQDDEYNDNEERIIYYDNVTWYNGGNEGYNIVNPNDNIITPTCDNHSAFEIIQAEDYCDQSGIQANEANTTIGYINNGDWLKFEGIDFSTGASSISASVSSKSNGGTIAIRQGSTSGTLLGSIPVTNTGSWTNFNTVTANISGASGTQDIYLVFTGDDDYLLDIDSFQFTKSATTTNFTPDPNKTYYIDAPHHNLRLAASGESETPYTTSTNITGNDVKWKFVDKGNGYWHIDRATGGTTPRLRTDNTEFADMQGTEWTGTYTYYEITPGYITGTYYLTLVHAPENYKRLQVNNSGEVKMINASHQGTWESFTFTEATTSNKLTNNSFEAFSITDTPTYPNPFNEIINISLDKEDFNIVKLIDLSGRLIIKKEFTNTNTATIKNLGELDKGIYLLQVYDKNNRIIKSKKLSKN